MNRTSLERTSDRELVIKRTFNGPARIVFDAWTRPELVSRWWAPKSLGVSVVSCDADIRVGGSYRYVLQRDKGDEIAFSGKYTEVTPHSRLVYTYFFEAKGFEPVGDAGAVIVTVTFDEHDGKTHLVAHELYPSKEVLDSTLASGMEHGLRATMDQLDELVASLR
ncbi:MAG: ATPase [Luteitalea sp.]|nr:ATPase [Luteitalea sp.]